VILARLGRIAKLEPVLATTGQSFAEVAAERATSVASAAVEAKQVTVIEEEVEV